MKPSLALALSALLVSAPAFAAAPRTLPLWPDKVPGETAPLPPETDTTKPTDNLIAGRPLVRLGNVTTPTLTLFAPKGKNTGAAVVVFPGGGYHILAIDLEGTEVCDWLNSAGITCVLL